MNKFYQRLSKVAADAARILQEVDAIKRMTDGEWLSINLYTEELLQKHLSTGDLFIEFRHIDEPDKIIATSVCKCGMGKDGYLKFTHSPCQSSHFSSLEFHELSTDVYLIQQSFTHMRLRFNTDRWESLQEELQRIAKRKEEITTRLTRMEQTKKYLNDISK